MPVKIISVFNNKGGVGKTTLTFHLAHALAESGKKVLAVDLDPQCNLSIYSLSVEQIQSIWEEENNFIDEPGFQAAKDSMAAAEFAKLCKQPRTIHFSLKSAEEGIGELEHLPPPLALTDRADSNSKCNTLLRIRCWDGKTIQSSEFGGASGAAGRA